ncbi:fimbria/pilus periplasmic chaperone [Paraburkholderia strydomiana]|jgi:chaperone protein EcpD|uniref:fimbria/pilus periplasmic chaperone n=1 Tax=Paraburkholderia strydomiana TaxID=1245417 RepID=UPI0038BD0373
MTVFALSWLAGGAQAGVVISGTRVIYQASEREVTVKLGNEGDAPALVQVWLDTGNPNALPDESKVPFTLSPPLFRLDPKKGQSLRLIYTQEPLPQDKESLFWLNVLEVPPRADAATGSNDPNSLQLAFRSRIKLFFRPAGLPGNADDAAAQVRWKFVRKENGGYALEASNPTPYHVTFSRIVVADGATNWTSDKGGMVDPGASADFDIGNLAPHATVPAQVDYTFINDYGAGVNGKRLRDGTSK